MHTTVLAAAAAAAAAAAESLPVRACADLTSPVQRTVCTEIRHAVRPLKRLLI